MHKQLEHYQTTSESGTLPVSLLLNDVIDPLNVGSIFRVADAMGLAHIFLCGQTPTPPHRRISKTSRQTERWQKWTYHPNAATLCHQLQAEHQQLIAIEITNQSQALYKFHFKPQKHYTLIVGNEEKGVSNSLLAICTQALHIPMRGHNSSINVAQASALAAYEALRQLSVPL